MKNITQEEWVDLITKDDKAVLIDTRTPNEWTEGIQENAILMDVLQPVKFEQATQALDKDKNYYVYCRSGQRSMNACRLLESAGIKTTFNLLGGMTMWKGRTVVPEL
ncbi:Protein containing rhodanese-like domain [hydrothermal vent metagenome]|uniref:Protein containing rhodanese-like domain n=1 Tax=hydrothermal vent metagenome TaxID=652676 RepID=A0A3B0T2N6_9ZZZZ